MTVQISELVEVFAQMYRDKFLAAHPSLELCEADAQVAFLRAIQETGHAVQHVTPDGTVTWTATSKFTGQQGEVLAIMTNATPSVH